MAKEREKERMSIDAPDSITEEKKKQDGRAKKFQDADEDEDGVNAGRDGEEEPLNMA